MRGKNILYTTSIILGFSSALATNPVSTYANWYKKPFFKMNVGYGLPNKLNDKYDGDRESKKPSNAMLYNVGWGYKLTNNLSTYLDYTNFRNMNHKINQQNATTEHNVRADLFNLNFQYNFNNKNHFMPYITAGAGVSKNKFGNYTVKDDTTNQFIYNEFANTHSQFAWNAGLGIEYKLNTKISIGTNYKYVHLGHVKSLGYGYNAKDEKKDDQKKSRFNIHTVNLGLTYNFN
jgi:opacity protein-like surface antigen